MVFLITASADSSLRVDPHIVDARANPVTIWLCGWEQVATALVVPVPAVPLFIYFICSAALILFLVNLGYSILLWPSIRGCHWMLNVAMGSPRYKRKAMLLIYYWARRCSLDGLRWCSLACLQMSTRCHWTPMSLGR